MSSPGVYTLAVGRSIRLAEFLEGPWIVQNLGTGNVWLTSEDSQGEQAGILIREFGHVRGGPVDAIWAATDIAGTRVTLIRDPLALDILNMRAASAGLAGHIIADEGAPLTQRGTLDFAGAGVTVTDGPGDKSLVTIPSVTLPPTHLGWLINRSAAQSIPNDTNTVVAFDAEVFDDDGFHDNAVNNSRVTFDADNAGRYACWLHSDFAADVDGYRRHFARLNGAGSIGRSLVTLMAVTTAGLGTIIVSYFEIVIAAGDYMEVLVRHLAGAALNLTQCHFGGHRIAA